MTRPTTIGSAGLLLGALLLMGDAAVAQQPRGNQDSANRPRAGQQTERTAPAAGEQDAAGQQRRRPAPGEQDAAGQQRRRPAPGDQDEAGAQRRRPAPDADQGDDAERRGSRKEVYKQTAHELKKHRERVARIERMLEIAKRQNQPEKVAALQAMLAKERERHGKFMAKLESHLGKDGVARLKDKIKERKSRGARSDRAGERTRGPADGGGAEGERTRRPADADGTEGERTRRRPQGGDDGAGSGERRGGRGGGDRDG